MSRKIKNEQHEDLLKDIIVLSMHITLHAYTLLSTANSISVWSREEKFLVMMTNKNVEP